MVCGSPITLNDGADRFSSGNRKAVETKSTVIKIMQSNTVTVTADMILTLSSVLPPFLALISNFSIPLLYSSV